MKFNVKVTSSQQDTVISTTNKEQLKDVLDALNDNKLTEYIQSTFGQDIQVGRYWIEISDKKFIQDVLFYAIQRD